MTVSAVFFTTSLAQVAHESGRLYTANSSGVLTVAYPDGAATPGGIGSILPIAYLTGTSTDRLTLNPAASNAFQAPGKPNLAFDDTTLSAWCFFVGALSSTGWVNSAGAAV